MIFLADLPPPIHGMSNVNLDIYEVFCNHGCTVKLLNTAPSKKAKYFRSKLWPILKGVQSITSLVKVFYLLFTNQHNCIYRPINGGKGQIYDIAYIAIARIFKARIFIHHHATSYITNESLLFKILLKTSGAETTHIVLGQSMANALTLRFSVPSQKIVTLSNCYFFESCPPQSTPLSDSTLAIGHLSNLCIDKGVDTFALLCRELDQLNISFTAKIAGPFADKHAEKIVTDLCKDLPCINYLGPLYGEAKVHFFHNLDIFILPSINEAEPLVLYEAAQHGAFLIGGTVGCMKDVIESLGGFSSTLENQKKWVCQTAKLISAEHNSISCTETRTDRLSKLQELITAAQENMQHILKALKNAEA